MRGDGVGGVVVGVEGEGGGGMMVRGEEEGLVVGGCGGGGGGGAGSVRDRVEWSEGGREGGRER